MTQWLPALGGYKFKANPPTSGYKFRANATTWDTYSNKTVTQSVRSMVYLASMVCKLLY
ncbi:hypothetical protein F511_07955 [Dorcoceras hygrometricum]|uniref:Uncharacterized protein n=1 Tax=Dorcoceras hygrometricum TaxID=472368 RepID=A0A2Z7CEQ4_9LAMI|nr:hypothetical protein F511_07955 [Dorcoceras hygrometricum]